MKVIQVEVPDQMAMEMDSLVRDGWFTDEGEIVRAAVMDFVRSHRFALLEQFQREDIRWAVKQKDTEV